MLKNPYINALYAAGYIGLLVLGLSTFVDGPKEDTLLAPLVMLSLLVLSVALMAVLFFYEPARLFMEGKREEALKFFTKTLLVFAILTALWVILLLIVGV